MEREMEREGERETERTCDRFLLFLILLILLIVLLTLDMRASRQRGRSPDKKSKGYICSHFPEHISTKAD
jgi:hypothetical protein